MSQDVFLQHKQCTALECGVINIQNTLWSLWLSIPDKEKLRKEWGIVSYKWKDVIGMSPRNYSTLLHKYVHVAWLRVIKIVQADSEKLRKVIKSWYPLSCLMMVEAHKNPARRWQNRLSNKWWFHYETILSIDNDVVVLANPFGYIEKCSRDMFEKRRSLSNDLLWWRDRIIKALWIVKPRTLFCLEEI